MIDQSKLYFIIGVGRSGTSLLQEIMNTFDNFCNLREARIGGPGNLSCYEFIRNYNDFSHLETFIQENWTKEYFVEKTPSSIDFLSELHDRFHDANYIFLERHPLKILLSQLNHTTEQRQEKMRGIRMNLGLKVRKKEFNSFEEFKAEIILRQIRRQVSNKGRFKNQVTIRYEELLRDFDHHVLMLESTFRIKGNLEAARQCLSRPSWSSIKNKYDIIDVNDPTAILYIKKACRLWHYDFRDAISIIKQK